MTTTTDQTQPRSGKGYLIAAVIVILALVAGLTLPFVFAGGNGSTVSAGSDVSAPLPSPSPTSTEEPVTETCDPLYEQVEVGNEQNRVDDFFSDIIDEAQSNPGKLDDNLRAALLERSGQSGQLLAIWSSAVNLHDDPNDWEHLVDGDCLSEEGQKLHTQFEGALKASGVGMGEAPADGYNSGVYDGTFGVDGQPGIRGDRTAVVITLPDGTKVYILTRCGNIVYEGKPPLPEVPTDNPPPPLPPPPPCPPGQVKNENGVCVTPKSSNPNDYRKPGDDGKGADKGEGTKPLAPAPTTSPAPSPAPVQTSKPGGGGVVDSPTKPPSSETGVTAPGASPAPTTPPTTPPPPNEGGGGAVEPVPTPSW